MKVHQQQHGAVAVLKPDGPLAGDDAGSFLTQLRQAVRRRMGRIAVDCSMVPFLDSAGLEGLVDVTDELSESGQALKLCGLNETVRQTLELTGVASQFEYFEDINAAVRSFL